MKVNTNINTLYALNNLRTQAEDLKTSLERLSTGKRINSAEDDAAGLMLSTRLTTQVNGNEQSLNNIRDGLSLAYTADSALSNIETQLQRMRELMLQAKNGTNAIIDKENIQKEIEQIIENINFITMTTNFNGVNLLNNTEVIFETSEIRTIAAGASTTFDFTIPPKDDSEGSILTFTTDKTLTGQTWTETVEFDVSNAEKNTIWNAPAGYTIRTASVRVLTEGDLQDSNERINLYVNNNLIGYNNYAVGNDRTYNITGIVQGGTSIDMKSIKTDQVGVGSARWILSVTYERIETSNGNVINQSLSGQTKSTTSTISMPAGYTIVSGTANVVTSGDVSGGDEYVELYVDGTYLGRESSVDGNNKSFNITSYISGQKSFNFSTTKSANAGDTTTEWDFTIRVRRDSDGAIFDWSYNDYIQSLSNTNSDTTSKSRWNTPSGFEIVSANMNVVTTGDVDESNEYVDFYANGTYVGRNGYTNGNNRTYNITSQVAGDNYIELYGTRSSATGSVNMKYTLDVTYRRIVSATSDKTLNLNDNVADRTQSAVFDVPEGYKIASAKVRAVTKGDLNESSPNEAISLYANGTLIGTQNANSGNDNTYDITNIVKGSDTIDLRGIKTQDVGDAEIEWYLELQYMPIDDTMTVKASNGETFGTNQQYLNNEQANTNNTSTVGSYYSKSDEQEQMTFYNPKDGVWTVTIDNSSSEYLYKFQLDALYEKATTVNIHTGYAEDNAYNFLLSKITNKTLGLEGLDVFDPNAINRIDTALEIIFDERSKYGKYINTLERRYETLRGETTIIKSSRSKIEDANMAKETSEMIRTELLSTMAARMISTSFENPRNILTLMNS